MPVAGAIDWVFIATSIPSQNRHYSMGMPAAGSIEDWVRNHAIEALVFPPTTSYPRGAEPLSSWSG
jgi:hypothetical protein